VQDIATPCESATAIPPDHNICTNIHNALPPASFRDPSRFLYNYMFSYVSKSLLYNYMEVPFSYEFTMNSLPVDYNV